MEPGARAEALKGALDALCINEGALAEQWIGQHLLDARPTYAAPELPRLVDH